MLQHWTPDRQAFQSNMCTAALQVPCFTYHAQCSGFTCYAGACAEAGLHGCELQKGGG